MQLFSFRAKKRKPQAGGRRRPSNGHAAAPNADLDGPIEPYGGPGWLTVVNVKKNYRKRMGVKGVSLEAGRGDAVGVLGPHAAGKTSLFFMVNGLVPAA